MHVVRNYEPAVAHFHLVCAFVLAHLLTPSVISLHIPVPFSTPGSVSALGEGALGETLSAPCACVH